MKANRKKFAVIFISFVFVAGILALAAPLYAENEIRFSFVDNWDGTCTVTYDVNEVAADPCDPPPIRPVAMGLTVEVTAGNPITGVTLEDSDPCGFMEIFMDAAYSIELDPCDPCGYQYGAGTPVAFFDVAGEAQLADLYDENDPCATPAPNDGMKFAISMGGLGGELAKTKEPPTSGSITLASDGGTEFVMYVNAVRGGIIGNDGAPMVAIGLDEGPAKNGNGKGKMSECYNEPDKRQKNNPAVGTGTSWYDSGKPVCWCFPRQCHGDSDGLKVGSTFLGYKWVGDPDGDIVSLGWKVKDKPVGVVGVIHPTGRKVTCADARHNKVGSLFSGYKRIDDDDGDEISLRWKCKVDAAGVQKPGQEPLICAPPDCIPNSIEINPCTGQPVIPPGSFSGQCP